MQVKKVIEIKQPNKINITTRCHSRIWNNIYNRKTMIEISNIDRKFKVSDFADINIKEFNAKYIIGTQCQRKQTANSMYCFQHIKHLPHGNYFEIPTQEICYHYLKDCNYL